MEFEDIDFTEFHNTLDEYCEVVKEKYKDKLISDDKFATGELIQSINTVIKTGVTNINVYINLAEHWKYVEFGRKPGGKFPPPDKIEAWIVAKPVIPYEDDNGKLPTQKQLAFLIGRKIARDGIKPGNYLHDTLEECNNIYLEKLKDALQKDFDTFSIKILREVNKSLKKWC